MGQYTQITIAQHESFSPGDSTATKIQKLLKNLHGEFMKGLLGSFQSPTKYMKPICIGFFGEAEDHEDLKKQLEDGDLIRGTITAEHQGSVDVPFSDKGFCPFQGQAGVIVTLSHFLDAHGYTFLCDG
uniref:Uncharacterized protein n=1 Tax=Brassica oleracea TaxID=3712 RepID=A0A3P6D0G5_BRAOL|nr:unnamed protein product [Brassica oleracea]